MTAARLHPDRARRGRRGHLPLALAALLLLAACGQAELYSKLTETQANEMIAVLQSAGIESEKAPAGENGWTLSTAKGDFSRAIEVLRAQGYPREEFQSLGTLFPKKGVLSSPGEERMRMTFGLQQELQNTISQIDGVVQARVHLALPEAQPLAEAPPPSSASVFIKYRQGAAIDQQIGKVKALVVNSVEGLKYENVTVETFPAEPLPISTARPQSSGMAGGVIAAIVAVAALVAAALGYPALRRWQLRRRSVVPHGGRS